MAQEILAGDVRAAARLMRDIDDEMPGAITILKDIYPHTGRAYLVGITGPPGSGKSSLVDRMVGRLRAAGKTVGIVAVDPTSPFSGGAILGDRIRMQRHFTDEGVFIRSLATRGHLGGLSASAADIVHVMDAMGKDVVIIETVGVGQDEVEISKLVHSCLVVTVPGLGDEIQAIKAGILEIADIFIVNKSDRDGADRTMMELQSMLDGNQYAPEAWRPMVLKTAALKDEGLDELLAAMEKHREFIFRHDNMEAYKHEKAEVEMVEILKKTLLDRVKSNLVSTGRYENLISGLMDKTTDPYTVTEEIIQTYFRVN